ncbi:hypothetical protein BDW02DRAFT_496576 [Decorospora gaudefroyi]|uniref:Uncharacterized protein n=1 Tax=Decorospora gaudefroyi TaxID=184978 RepID=A0A6A5KHZ1_9PLEO|nr:hypothetical protein BDW02DRAFT_496576 [Decorospora gaudefroyi]
MAPAQAYHGPTALSFSKYAPQQQRKVASADNMIPSREQAAATNSGSHVVSGVAQQNANVQLASPQPQVLKDEVDKHGAEFSRTVSTTVTNTHRLLELIRASMPDTTGLPVDMQWNELEHLFAAAKGVKTALPVSLEKQRDDMSLYHTSKLNEAVRDMHEELSNSHKKVDVQQNLILEHQPAFQEYEAQTAGKLKDLEDLKERVSRLTLEKGNFRTEIDRYVQLLEQEQSTKAENHGKVADLQAELEMLADAKKQLLAEVDTLRKEVVDLQGKMNDAEKEITDRFTAELKSTADLLMKESQKTTALNAMISQLEGVESTARLEADKAKKENVMLNERYNSQAAEHSKSFVKVNEQTKQIEALNVDVGRFQEENAHLKLRLNKLTDLEKQIMELNEANSKLSAQTTKLTSELEVAQGAASSAHSEAGSLLEKLESLGQEVKHLGSENTKLKATIDELEAAKVDGGPSTSVNEAAVRDYEDKIFKLETSKNQWENLAKLSYIEYKEILPTYQMAEHHRKDALEKEEMIEDLERKLTEAEAAQLNGMAIAGGDTGYWKAKYETLLATVGG